MRVAIKDIATIVGMVVMTFLTLIGVAGRAFDWRDFQETARYLYV